MSNKLALTEFIRSSSLDVDIMCEWVEPAPGQASPDERRGAALQARQQNVANKPQVDVAQELLTVIVKDLTKLGLDRMARQDGGLGITLSKPDKPVLQISQLMSDVNKKISELGDTYPTEMSNFLSTAGRNIRDIVLKLTNSERQQA